MIERRPIGNTPNNPTRVSSRRYALARSVRGAPDARHYIPRPSRHRLGEPRAGIRKPLGLAALGEANLRGTQITDSSGGVGIWTGAVKIAHR
jgi:hypothetical protein